MAYSMVLVVLGFATATILSSWAYFRRFSVTRPPIGVFNLRDVVVMIGGIILMPYLYLVLPLWLVASMLAVANLTVLYTLWEPILRTRCAIWPAVLAGVSADAGAPL